MGYTPYGYKIENGCAIIDEENADKIRKLYSNYLTGMPLAKAARKPESTLITAQPNA